MTPPEHFLLGFTTANIYYSALYLTRKNKLKQAAYSVIALSMALAAVLPDIDSFFGHYVSTNPFIGHRGMTHSILGVFVLGFFTAILIGYIAVLIFRLVAAYWKLLKNCFYKNGTREGTDFSFFRYFFHTFHLRSFLIVFFGTFLAGITHLVADLPQPPSVWEGIPILFPLTNNGEYIRYGGWNLIGWFDLKILWLLAGAVVISFPLVIISKLTLKAHKRACTICGSLFLFSVIVINSGILFWTARYIASSTYISDRAWNASQMKWVNEQPAIIRDITKNGYRIVRSLFVQVRRRN